MPPCITDMADVSASSLWVMFLYDFTLPMRVRIYLWFISLSICFVSCRRSVCRWWLYADGSMV